MTTQYHTPYADDTPANAATFNGPPSQLDSALYDRARGETGIAPYIRGIIVLKANGEAAVAPAQFDLGDSSLAYLQWDSTGLSISRLDSPTADQVGASGTAAYLGKSYGVSNLARLANQSINASAETAISWDTEVFDNAAMWAAGSPTRLTPPKNFQSQHLYCIVEFTTGGAAGTTYELRYRQSGTYINEVGYRVRVSAPANSTTYQLQLTVAADLTSSAYSEFAFFHDDGGSVNIKARCIAHVGDS